MFGNVFVWSICSSVVVWGMMEYNLVIPLKAPSVNEYLTPFRNRIILSKKGREFKEQAIRFLKEQFKDEVIKCKVAVSMNIHLKHKRSWDLDNRIKSCLDVLTGIVYEDDSQVYRLNVEKFFDSEEDCVEINIKVIGDKWIY